MKNTRTFLLLLATIAALLAGCRKDTINQTDVVIPPDPTVVIQTGAFGYVVDETGGPVEAATIKLGATQTQTDENGYFSITGLANEIQPFVRVEKTGFFPSLSSFSTKTGDMGRVKITLRSKTLAAQFDAGTGGPVNVPGGGAIQFAADGFVDAAGQAYAGPVLVYATYLDPSQPQTTNMIPGSMQGRNSAGDAQVLLSYGMIHALLETPSGDKLQLSKPAQITVPVPADRLSNAPAEIPLWYIDEATSLWQEEGSAVLDGSVYKGQVSHFSWWNCDAGFPVVTLSGILRIGSMSPFMGIHLTRPNGATASTTPSATGYFSGKIPANEVLLMEVTNECGDVVYSENIGPFSSDTDLGIISINWSTDWVEVSGTLLDCDQNPVTNGYVSARTNNQASGSFPIHIDPTDGTFSGAIANCSGTEVSLVGYDLSTLKTSATQTKPVAPQVDFGDVVACDAQVATGILIEYGNGLQKHIDNATIEIKIPTGGGGGKVFVIHANDTQGGGNLAVYTITILNWSNNPSDPLFGSSVDVQLVGQPVYYNFGTGPNGTSNVEILQQGTQPGELFIIKLSDIDIDEYPADIHYPNGTVTITAIIQ